MQERTWVFAALVFLATALAGCGSGACRQTPCMPGIPLLAGTCKCVPGDDGGPPLDAAYPYQAD